MSAAVSTNSSACAFLGSYSGAFQPSTNIGP